MAFVVMLAVRWVGLLLINAMLILPAAAARNVARSLRSYVMLTLVFSLFSGLLGLVLSYLNAVATGPMIVLVSATVFFGTFFMAQRK
jgi:zinc transport system permease protein